MVTHKFDSSVWYKLHFGVPKAQKTGFTKAPPNHKKTISGQYLNNDSNHPNHGKTGLDQDFSKT